MPRRERLIPLFAVSAVLAIAILIAFQLYLIREPARLEADAADDLQAAQTAGGRLFNEQCVACHGDHGQGGVGPALNSRALLTSASDELLFNLIRTGVPGTSMPAWGQVFGGPLTDEEIRQVVAYLRAWEAGAPYPDELAAAPDPSRGALIFDSTCIVCHGREGSGTDRAPALNDPELLDTFDNEWFRQTIAQGRPSKGMPTWGTVLSPEQIDDIVALLALWREGRSLQPGGEEQPGQGEALFTAHCAACHGAAGGGGVGPALAGNAFIAEQRDTELTDFILAGRPGTAMVPFAGRLEPEETAAIVELLRTWQP